MTKRIAIYPGTFDPITLGHVDIVKRAAVLFDQLIIAVAASARKSPLFSLNDRLKICEEEFAQFKNVQVKSFTNLIVNFARENEAKYIIKGLRGVSDLDYEWQMASMNKTLAADIETIFLPASDQYSFISATMIREIIALGGDPSPFVPMTVIRHLKRSS